MHLFHQHNTKKDHSGGNAGFYRTILCGLGIIDVSSGYQPCSHIAVLRISAEEPCGRTVCRSCEGVDLRVGAQNVRQPCFAEQELRRKPYSSDKLRDGPNWKVMGIQGEKLTKRFKILE